MEKERKLPDDIPLSSVWKSFAVFVVIGFFLIFFFYGSGRYIYLLELWTLDHVFLYIGGGVLAGALFSGLVAILYYVVKISFPKNEYTKLIIKLLHKKYGIFTVAVGAGVSEEILFRGALLGVLLNYIGSVPALLFVSFVFMALHIPQYKGSILIHTVVFVMGMVLGLLFLWTESLWAPIAAHVTYNGIMGWLMKNTSLRT